ncbi:MAG TPA: hypothetical protein DEW39_05020 [Brevibacterium sp.]|nr:hypothetical protein [Brevibacterium sp.]
MFVFELPASVVIDDAANECRLVGLGASQGRVPAETMARFVSLVESLPVAADDGERDVIPR